MRMKNGHIQTAVSSKQEGVSKSRFLDCHNNSCRNSKNNYKNSSNRRNHCCSISGRESGRSALMSRSSFGFSEEQLSRCWNRAIDYINPQPYIQHGGVVELEELARRLTVLKRKSGMNRGRWSTMTEALAKDDATLSQAAHSETSREQSVSSILSGAAACACACALSFAILTTSFCDASLAEEGVGAASEENLMSDFNVEFVGRKVDHKVIVELVVLGQTIGFVGAMVGGFSARSRKREVEELNQRLIAVNKQLRQQARSTMIGNYEPDSIDLIPSTKEKKLQSVTGSGNGDGLATVNGNGVDSFHNSNAYEWKRSEVIEMLRAGKKALQEQDAQEAVKNFKQSLEMAHSNADVLDNVKKVERKAYRGLGGAYLILHDYDNALMYMKKVLDLSEEMHETTGVGDALGVIADIYTDKGDFEKAGEWYDKYLECMTNEMDGEYSTNF